MPRLSQDEMRVLMSDVMEWVGKVEEMEKLADTATGETRSAYALVYKDYLWKIQRKVGKLWFYVCGVDDMNPFEIPIPPEQSKSE